MPRSVNSSIAATRACAAPTRDATRERSWLPSTQFGHAPSGSAASYSSISDGERARLPRRRDQVHVRRHLHPGGVVAGEPLERQVELADHHAAALGDRLGHRAHRREVVVVGAADRQQRVVLRLARAVVGVGRVVAPLGILEDLAQRVDAEAVDAAVEPEAQHAEHRLAQLRVAPVQVGLLAQVGVVVELPALGIERPRRPAEHARSSCCAGGRSSGTSRGARGTTGAPPTCGWGRSRAAAAGRARARRRRARRSPRACRTAARSRVWSEMS